MGLLNFYFVILYLFPLCVKLYGLRIPLPYRIYGGFLLLNRFILPKFPNPLPIEFKTFYRVKGWVRDRQLRITNLNLKPTLYPLGLPQKNLYRLFKAHVKLNLLPYKSAFTVHYSMRAFYVRKSQNTLIVVSLIRFFQRWKDFYYLIYNLFYYEIGILSFGTIFLKKEILSIN